MTVIRPNSIAGVTSITAQDQQITFHTSDGTTIGQLNANVNATNGVSTVANLRVTGVSTVSALGVTGLTTSANLTVTGITTLGSSNGIGTVTIGIGTTALLVQGNARITGILTVGSSSITFDGTNNRINVGTGVTINSTGIDLSQTTQGIALPQGTTAQRPSGSNPYLRWNTSNSALEFYNGTDWVEIISDYFPSGSTILG
jgi:hypothetical protein